MKSIKFIRQAAQGDLLITKIEKMPKGFKKAKSENGKFIVAHSETGHHHTVLERNAQMLINETNEFIACLKIDKETQIVHERSFDTHAPITLDPGIYEIRRQREYTPQGFRKAQD